MKKRQFTILIILLVVGFASVTTGLIINGNTIIAFKKNDYDVIFIEALLNGTESENASISADKKTITFTTDKLINVGDSARLDYKVKNISNQYDADVTINCTTEANEYLNITSFFDNQTIPLSSPINIKAQEVKSGYINVELNKVYAGDDMSVDITCKIDFTATSREEYAYSLIFDSNGGSKIDDKTVNLNDNYGDLEEPIKEGYTFLGWFDEDDVKVDNSTVFNTKGNRNLHAKWSKDAYKVELKKVYPDKTETSEINIPYGESIDTLITVGEKYYIDEIECTTGYTLDNFDKNSIIYNEQTIKITNEKVTKEGVCTLTILQGVYDYSYTGGEQEFIVPLDGKYKFELWGAGLEGAGGAYTSGIVTLTKDNHFYAYVGEQQQYNSALTIFNSGTKGVYLRNYYRSQSSSGATDIRIVAGPYNEIKSLANRIIVAAGAGSSASMCLGGAGGGLNGYNGTSYNINKPGHNDGGVGGGASQVAGGLSFHSTSGKFGIGAQGVPIDGTDAAGSGGGGWYGGGAGYDWDESACGGSGSSYISGHTGCVAITSLSSTLPKNGCSTGTSDILCSISPTNYVFTNTVMIDGAGYNWTNVKGEQTGMTTQDGKSTMTGNSGNGYAKITYLGK